MTIHGFELKGEYDLRDYSARGYLYRHIRTGMQVFNVICDDSEYFFSYSFKTLPYDSSGVFHILEHTILSGSRKYPLEDPFTVFESRSCNTYMNALTCPDRTLYPAASPVKKDFENIFLLYTDSVFRPLLRRKDFESEGIRAGSKGFEGVVFNEMRGDSNQTDSLVATHSKRDLFPDSPYSHSSGGDIREMVHLTYEAYKDAYDKFYTPANCRLFIYGRDVDIEEKLRFLDEEYLCSMEGGIEVPSTPDTERWKEPRKETVYSQASSPDDKGDLMLSFLSRNKSCNPYDNLLVSVIVDALLGGPSNPLYAALLDSRYGSDVSDQSGMSADFNEIPFSVGLCAVDEDKRDEIGDFIIDTIRNIAENGIGDDIVEASVRRQEFLLQEVAGGIPNGLRMFLKCIRAWDRNLDLGDALDMSAQLGRLRSDLQEDPRLLEHWMIDNLVNNPHRLSLYVKPVGDQIEKEEEFLEKEFRERKKNRVKTEEKESVPYPAQVSIPSLSIDDIKENEAAVKCEKAGDGILYQIENTCSITYISLVIDLSDKSSSDLVFAMLLSRYALMAGLKGEDSSSFHRRMRLASGGYYSYLETGRASDGEVKAFFVFRIKCLSRQSGTCLELLRKWVSCLNMDDMGNCVNAMNDIISDYESYVEESGSSYASSLASASLTPSCSLGEKLMGISFWQTLKEMDITCALEGMRKMYECFSDRNRMTVHLTSQEAEKAHTVDEASAFLGFFKTVEEPGGGYGKPVEEKSRAIFYNLSSSVAYNAIALRSSGMNTREQEAESILAHIYSTTTLWNEIRSVNGAYGAEASLDGMEEVFVVATYRDPHIAASFDLMKSALEDVEITGDAVENCKMIRLGRLLKPLSPSQKANLSLRRHIYKISDEMRSRRREYMKDISTGEVEAAKERLLSAFDDASAATLAPLSLFRKEGLKTVDERQLPS